ncbi:MarR family EPS-associated transcriptional regulator [Paucibacter sp. APW11]|uniref:MarR family EPS-associated transcriptional regulator n=1 Tax=Roseateles aquae TaxID=3077235 RepID=A0ABU3PGJ7_9BURK|nr:MarR family EPS-associated transcriptional regulator [Paucibacter sp. APW11]MDT9001267.1 MarR family EPS-associated transcriptional regulator [Paucibacter sp. APW11]
MPHRHADPDLELATMRAVEQHAPESQRQLAGLLGVSVGKVNFILNALLNKGLLKVENFRRSDNKLGYLYLLTPHGLQTKTRLTKEFLRRKEREYIELQCQISLLRDELASSDAVRQQVRGSQARADRSPQST